MKKYYYVEKQDVQDALKKITDMQVRANRFCNVAVKPYRGKAYDPERVVVIVVG